jgi:hypothetical protein
MFTGVEDYLVAGRECGACTACCTHLHVDEPDLQKLAGITCTNCSVGNGCAVYATRPKICRSWFCGWRIMREFDDAWRPDRSQILIALETENIPEQYETRFALRFDLIGSLAVVLEPRFLECVVAMVEEKNPVFVCVPKSPGRAAGKTFLNEMLEEPVRLRDVAAIRRLVVEAVGAAAKHEGEALTLKHAGVTKGP